MQVKLPVVYWSSLECTQAGASERAASRRCKTHPHNGEFEFSRSFVQHLEHGRIHMSRFRSCGRSQQRRRLSHGEPARGRAVHGAAAGARGAGDGAGHDRRLHCRHQLHGHHQVHARPEHTLVALFFFFFFFPSWIFCFVQKTRRKMTMMTKGNVDE